MDEDILLKTASIENIGGLIKITSDGTPDGKMKKEILKKIDPGKAQFKHIPEIAINPRRVRLDFVTLQDNLALMTELQGTTVNDSIARRFRAYHSLYDLEYNHGEKEILFVVISTVEDPKVYELYVDRWNKFKFLILSLKHLDEKELLNTCKYKVENNIEIEFDELFKLALSPIISKKKKVPSEIKKIAEFMNNSDVLNKEEKDIIFSISAIVAKYCINDEICKKKQY